jgi:DNA (cytosine-5)-methyltransferase 1
MNVLGLFSGIGGFELGLQQAGFTIDKMCEIEYHCQRVLEKNFDCIVHDDITALQTKEGEFDIMCGGFPCQDISIAGKNKGLLGGEKSSLWREYLRLIETGKPKYAVIENVSGLLGRGIEIIIQDLAEIGYDTTYTTYDTKYFGLPQRRRRVYIVAVRDGIPSGTEIFDFSGRDSADHRVRVDHLDKGREWNFTKEQGVRNPFAFFTRQRSDQFAETGLSGTLAKRDYKSFTDLILQFGRLRRVSPKERLLLQGYPSDWFDGCDLTKQQKFSCNGMSVPVVKYIGELINEFEKTI